MLPEIPTIRQNFLGRRRNDWQALFNYRVKGAFQKVLSRASNVAHLVKWCGPCVQKILSLVPRTLQSFYKGIHTVNLTPKDIEVHGILGDIASSSPSWASQAPISKENLLQIKSLPTSVIFTEVSEASNYDTVSFQCSPKGGQQFLMPYLSGSNPLKIYLDLADLKLHK